jgi:hypothetical protein
MTEQDAQHRAFSEASISDWARSAALLEDAVVHEPGDPDAEPIRTPEEWNEAGWDSERQRPKNAGESTTALLGRLLDPEAPDDAALDYSTTPLTDEQAGAA